MEQAGDFICAHDTRGTFTHTILTAMGAMDNKPRRPRYKRPPDRTEIQTGSDDALKGRITILDRFRLTRLLREAVERRYQGNLNHAARDAGIPQPTLHRWVNDTRSNGGSDKVRKIDRRHVDGIFKLLGDGAAELFEHPSAWYAKTLYVRWMDEMIDHLLGLKVDSRVFKASPEGPWKGRQTEFQALLRRIREEAPHVGAAINLVGSRLTFVSDECEEILSTIGKMSPRMKNHPAGNYIDPARFTVAVYRMLDPLLNAAASGWVERRHLELSPEEFEQFVSAGWKRESIMLSRKDDALRLQRVHVELEDDPRLGPLTMPRRRSKN